MKEIIATLGADKGASLTAIKKWRQRGEVPTKYWFPILELAEQRGVAVTKHDFVFPPSLKPKKKRGAPKPKKRRAA